MAKNSRNFIAHELTVGLEITSEDAGGRKRIIEAIKEPVLNIIEAEKVLLRAFCVLNKEELPTIDYYNTYSQKIIDWVVKMPASF